MSNSYMIDYEKLADALNIYQQRISSIDREIKEARLCNDRIQLSRRKKRLKHMQRLLFNPERAYAFIEKNRV